MCKHKIWLILTIFSSFFGYLQWGNNQSKFLFQIEAEILKKITNDPISVIHPFVVLPLLGQIILMTAIIKSKMPTILIYIGLGGIGILLAMVLFIGIWSSNIKILLSALPFISCTAGLIYSMKNSTGR